MVRVSMDASKAMLQMKAIAGRHFPFAFAKSLTDLAKLGRDGVRLETRKRFKLHGEFIPRGITIQAAKKSELKTKGRTNAFVLTRPLVSDFMPRHETGGVKTPGAFSGASDKGRMLAIPAPALRKRKYRTKTGKVRKQYRPSELLKYYNQLRPEQAARQRGSRQRFAPRPAFIIEGKGGQAMIVRRRSAAKGRNYPLEVLYFLVPTASISPRWGFEDTVIDVVKGNFGRVFKENIEMALATATR